MSNPKLTFSMKLSDSSSLVTGNLELIDLDGKEIDYLATSGLCGYQDKDNIWTRARGPIPPGSDYSVPTIPYYLSTKGIEGNFFHITPDPITSSQGITRGEFGVHFDANGPGSAGCIVLIRKESFNTFCERMKKIADAGVNSIPLKIVYS
ncbi:hypothetical protein [Nostoc sp. CALU 1950]|uniref:hypothetical protein n=1 Tax=Nostoc sp. CALU 1950 TaxID=3104321 RepID=UPI003EC05A26